MLVRLRRTVCTRGQCPTDVGTGYSYVGPNDRIVAGDISWITRGYYQGYDEEAHGVLVDGYTLDRDNLGRLRAYPGGLDANESIAAGILRPLPTLIEDDTKLMQELTDSCIRAIQ